MRSQGIVLAKMWCLGLGWCFWGDAHAGVSCRLQVGAPSLPSATRRAQAACGTFYAATETVARPGHRAG